MSAGTRRILRIQRGEGVTVNVCEECGRVEGEQAQAGCCPGCGRRSRSIPVTLYSLYNEHGERREDTP